MNDFLILETNIFYKNLHFNEYYLVKFIYFDNKLYNIFKIAF